ncbi:hypothetical protein GTHT12_03680 (plasmid) [Geobacillus thermodenitrificans]|uniref:hypothetical protein n=1 Tax=Geobacillus thermodenitrificans TaxID=33940 RepID=UPI000A295652|nr:hypothetical protein [Geobacillus thermodenitrificans]ARP44549.1 hypothetical protein GTHT12_03680 [Geobacillus thermodenitrificans]
MRLTISINREINKLIGKIAEQMGTSKRNVIAFALAEILQKGYSFEQLEVLKEKINLDSQTTIFLTEEMARKIEQIDRFGLSKRTFFGLLVSDYFKKNEKKFPLAGDIEAKNNDLSRDYICTNMDEELKKKITDFCKSNSIAMSFLFSYYLLAKNVQIRPFQIKKREYLHLNMNTRTKKVLDKKSSDINVTRQFYLHLIALQICEDFNL